MHGMVFHRIGIHQDFMQGQGLHIARRRIERIHVNHVAGPFRKNENRRQSDVQCRRNPAQIPAFGQGRESDGEFKISLFIENQTVQINDTPGQVGEQEIQAESGSDRSGCLGRHSQGKNRIAHHILNLQG